VSDEPTRESPPEGTPAPAERADLPKWNRARVKRSVAPTPGEAETDAFQGAVRQAGRGAVRKAPIIMLALVLVAGAVGGVVWWRGKQAEGRAEATAHLAEAAAYVARGRVDPSLPEAMKERVRPLPEPVFESEEMRQQKIEDALSQLETRAQGTAADALGDLVRGGHAMRKADFAAAEAAFGRFVEGHPSHDLAYLAREGLLLAREAVGDLEGALTHADALVGDDPTLFYRDQGLWHRGRLLEALGRGEEALAAYHQYATEFPLEQPSVARESVVERLSELDPASVPSAALEPDEDALPPGVLFQ
jgi:hypothetical protein